MLDQKLSVAFYGHTRQYHNIKAEIDAEIKDCFGERPVRDGTGMASGLSRSWRRSTAPSMPSA